MDWKKNNQAFWKKESKTFDLTADYYDLYRPGYPAEIIKTLIERTGINADSKILEVGAGSGKATEYFVPGNFNVLCIEQGENLVKAGRRKFKDHGNIRFETGRFEEHDLPGAYYDLIFSAQAFHWIPQPAGYEKCAYVLKKNGRLALFWNMYITYDCDRDRDRDLVELSKKHGGFADFLSEEGCERRIESIFGEMASGNLFEFPEVKSVLWEQPYTADEYFGFILTGNNFAQKSDSEKEQAHRDILALAEKYNGTIVRPYLCVLYLSRKIQG